MEASMNERVRTGAVAPGYRTEPLRGGKQLYIGIDVGSTSSDVVVLDNTHKVVFCDYRYIEAGAIETARSQLEQVLRLLGKDFVNEVPAQAAAICHLYPHLQAASIIEMGGQDSKLIFLAPQQVGARISDFTLSSSCAAGTGSFLDQQALRLGINIEGQFGEMALASKSVPRMAGRCAVFAKTDMIHLQQQATPTSDIIAGLCLALARNLKSTLGCGREFVRPFVFTGGVAANVGVVRALEQVFELGDGELLVPDEHFFTGAIGAVLVAKTRECIENNGEIQLEKIDSYLARRGTAVENAPRRRALGKPTLPPPESVVYGHLLSDPAEPINAYLGVDVGSISTNVVVMDEQKRVLAKEYLMTAGRPLEAVRRGLDAAGRKVNGKVKILGAATTGSGRYVTGDFIGADIVINEITAQAAGTAIVNPDVDTIFEIGGQDSKYISLDNGVVVDFEMNHACAAGTGSFLEEQAQRLGININKEFAELALASQKPIKLGERCTVFMESDLLSYQQQGAKTEELVAGLSYSIVDNYLNRVVGRRRIGDNICFQGGTAFNKAVWSAFEQVTGKPIMVPDHHEVTGALGAASIAAEFMKEAAKRCGSERIKSKFRGFENIVGVDYTVESFVCEHCPNHCEVKKVQLPETVPLYYGSRCDRYNVKKSTRRIKGLGAFEYRSRALMKFAGLDEQQSCSEAAKAGTIGIPMALVYWQLLPLFARFFKSLGFEVVLSGRTDKQVVRKGVELVPAQPCFPVKVAYGHIAELIEKKVDYIFLPSIVSMRPAGCQNKNNQLCPFVQSLAYQVQTAFAGKLGRTKILTAVLRLGEGQRLLQKSFIALGKKLKISATGVRRAIKEGLCAQDGFELAVKEKGTEYLDKIRPDQKLFVLISRPYNGCDEGLNLQLPKKLAELGVAVIPMDMLGDPQTRKSAFGEPLDPEQVQQSDESLHKSMYWTYGQKILGAAEVIKDDPRLYAIYLSNFGCGPDSFLMTFFKDIMGQKPCLQLELDEHSADAGVITRLEAFLESLKNYQPVPDTERPVVKEPVSARETDGQGKLYIPYMSDCSYGLAACITAYGQPAEVMPIADSKALLRGRAVTTGKECLPFVITAGEMLTVLADNKAANVSEATTFFMPTTSGPCRFGMYNCMHKLLLQYGGAEKASVTAPNQDSGFYEDIASGISCSTTGFMKAAWISAVGLDLLGKLILRLRPFAAEANQVQALYEGCVNRWVSAVEQRRSLSQMRSLMADFADEFAAVELDKETQKPMVGIVGEIYVRNHPFANMNIVARLEELGAACELASLAEWVYYTNFARKQMARRRRQLRNLFTNVVADYLQYRIEKTLAGPLEKMLRGLGHPASWSQRGFDKLAEEPIENVIELARPYLHHSFEGEAILTVGKTIEFSHRRFGGVVNVMPFSCMPSTVVSSLSTRLSTDCGNMPILDASFDGQEDSTLTTRLEAFVEQVRGRQSQIEDISKVKISS